jgi:deoxyribodipyrimidine photo-lyase
VEGWSKKFEGQWDVGEKEAANKLVNFIENGLNGYHKLRNNPAKSTSKLSAHLHLGEISIKQVSNAVSQFPENQDKACFLNELIWREFSYYLLYHFPNLPEKNFQEKFDNFPWEYNQFFLEAWQKGETGYPIVDAGMRELWQTGFMHNRARLVVSSWLCKDMEIHWRLGERYFASKLLDYDISQNMLNWCFVTSPGLPFTEPPFRVYNPDRYQKNFDPDHKYLDMWS